jgi:hypothetical protein
VSDEIRLRREDLLSAEVTRAVERERRLAGRATQVVEEVSPFRRLILSPLFHLPLAGLIAALAAWAILEPRFHDWSEIGGRLTLVNRDPMVPQVRGSISWTVGTKEVLLVPGATALERGADGQPPFESFDAVEIGTVVEASGLATHDGQMLAIGIRPATAEHAAATGQDTERFGLAGFLLFPLTAVFVAFALLLAEGLVSRNWMRMADRMLVGLPLTLAFVLVGFIPAGIVAQLGQVFLQPPEGKLFYTIKDLAPVTLLVFSATRSLAWAIIGAATGFGMNLARSTPAQRRNSVVGGALGGALGGLFFDPIDRFFRPDSAFAGVAISRGIGLAAVGLAIGLFVALVENLAREAWLRVRTGPLAGKQFVLFRTPTTIGSAPRADVYLFKDAAIDPQHAVIHRVGSRYEIEDLSARTGTQVGGQAVRRHRLSSGDVIQVGSTVLEFEERAKKP